MKRIGKYLAAVCVIALAGVLFAGCSNQGSSGSAAASSAAANSTDALIAELQAVADNNNYNSVTMDMKGTVKVDYAAMLGSEESSASASAEASSAADSSTVMEVPMNINAKCDKSSGTIKMYMVMDMMGQNIEMYINGDQAVMVVMGQAVSATLEELGMGQYGSIESIMESQGGSFAKYKDAIKSIEKSTENGETVYKVSVDPTKVEQSDTSGTAAQAYGADSIDGLDMVYRVNSEGRLVGVDIDMKGKGFSSVINTTFTDYDSTVVPDAPEATMKYSDIVNGGTGASAAAASASSAAAEASSEAAKAA